MLYFALFPDKAGNLVDEATLLGMPNQFADLLPEEARWSDVVHVTDVAAGSLTLYADAERQRVAITMPPTDASTKTQCS